MAIVISLLLIVILLYIIIRKNNRKALEKIADSEKKYKKYLAQDKRIGKEFKNNTRVKYLSDFSSYPVTQNNEVTYYPIGEKIFERMLEELRKAEKFIFFECFIIKKGKMWDSILQILEEKVSQGVDVRVMYDGFGSLTTLPISYPKELEKKGIKCVVFNKLSLKTGIMMKNRDHRKIIVVDGRVAFSGGINIGDEYININSKYGQWKDNGISISGDGVWNYTVMFLSIWNAFRKQDKDFKKFKYNFKNKKIQNGYVLPYGETPLDDKVTGEKIYLNIINQANRYVYIFTPYFIVNENMIKALQIAVKRGVDVRIVIPGVPDKKMVYILSEYYVEVLVNAGIKVYKYISGFIHGKVLISDDHIATVSTINMDFRSLYDNFECGCYLEDVDEIQQIKADFDNTIKQSHEITKQESKSKGIKRIYQKILKLFARFM